MEKTKIHKDMCTLLFSMSSDEYDFISAVDNILAMQRDAKAKGCAGITLEEINKEISDYRKGL